MNSQAPALQTRLLNACETGSLDLVKSLINEGGEVYLHNAMDEQLGYLPIHRAVKGGNLDTVRFLIQEKNVKVDAPSRTGGTPAMYSGFYNQLSILQFFVEEKGVDVNYARPAGITILIFAAQEGSLDCLNYLIEHGANVDAARIIDRCTPLMIAALQNRLEVVKALCSAGANISMKATFNRTALFLAKIKGSSAVVKYLRDELARIEKIKEDAKAEEEEIHARLKESDLQAKHRIEQIKAFIGTARYSFWVCKRAGFLELHVLPKHEIARNKAKFPNLMFNLSEHIELQYLAQGLVLFISHRWLEDEHPDRNQRKLKHLQALLQLEIFKDIMFIWIDYCCISQLKNRMREQKNAIDSLPYYITRCHQFLTLFGESEQRSSFDEYIGRGWCRIELMAANTKTDIIMWKSNIDLKVEESLDRFDTNFIVPNPLEGIFREGEKDKLDVAPMVKRLCELTQIQRDDREDIQRNATEIKTTIDRLLLSNSTCNLS